MKQVNTHEKQYILNNYQAYVEVTVEGMPDRVEINLVLIAANAVERERKEQRAKREIKMRRVLNTEGAQYMSDDLYTNLS